VAQPAPGTPECSAAHLATDCAAVSGPAGGGGNIRLMGGIDLTDVDLATAATACRAMADQEC
jgi:hypothetical protein